MTRKFGPDQTDVPLSDQLVPCSPPALPPTPKTTTRTRMRTVTRPVRFMSPGNDTAIRANFLLGFENSWRGLCLDLCERLRFRPPREAPAGLDRGPLDEVEEPPRD